MAVGDRGYFRVNCTVLSYDSDTTLRTELGQGTMTKASSKLTNEGLCDTATDFEFGPYTYTFEGEFRYKVGGTNWWTKQGASGVLIFTEDGVTKTGTFGVLSVSKVLGDALRWNVQLESKGAVT